MGEPYVHDGCLDCGHGPADPRLNRDGPLCDRCFDGRIVVMTGFPRLPEAPEPVLLVGADGRFCGEGYVFEAAGDHRADVAALAATVRAEVETEVGRRYLQPGPSGMDWQVAGDEVEGRLVCEPEGGPNRVVVDARRCHGVSSAWRELGLALGPFERYRIRLFIDDPSL